MKIWVYHVFLSTVNNKFLSWIDIIFTILVEDNLCQVCFQIRPALFFFFFNFSPYMYKEMVRPFVGPDLGPNSLQRLSADGKNDAREVRAPRAVHFLT